MMNKTFLVIMVKSDYNCQGRTNIILLCYSWQYNQLLSEHSRHTPLRTQWSPPLVRLGNRMYIRKLVEWPVVASTPLRSAVRYTGHS